MFQSSEGRSFLRLADDDRRGDAQRLPHDAVDDRHRRQTAVRSTAMSNFRRPDTEGNLRMRGAVADFVLSEILNDGFYVL